MSEANIALVRRWFDEVWNQRRADVIDELLTPESLCYADTGLLRGPDDFKVQLHGPFLATFPDLWVDVDALIVQDDQVVVRWSATGLHSGDGLGLKPTDKTVRFRGITWVQVRDGKLMEAWQNSNIPEVLRDLADSDSASS